MWSALRPLVLVAGCLLASAALCTPTVAHSESAGFSSRAGQWSSGPLRLEDLPAGWEQQVDAYIANMTACQGIIGLSVSIVAANTSIYAKGFGTVSLEAGAAPVDADTLFAIGSTTKAFTSALLSILNDDGFFPLGWNTFVTSIAKDFSFADASLNQRATILDLVAMRLGISQQGMMMFKNETRTSILYDYQLAPPAFPLRERFLYSNEMVTLAGHLAEIIAGQPWEQLIQEKLLTPLGMLRSSGNITEFRLSDNRAFPYGWNPTIANWSILPDDVLDPFENMAMAGGMSTSANDAANWLLLHLNNGYDIHSNQRLISAANMNIVHRPWMIMGAGPFPFVEPTNPFSNANLGYGCGWMEDRYQGRQQIWHDGEVFGFSTEMVFMPLDGVGIFLSQTGSFLGEETLFGIRSFIQNVLLGLPQWLHSPCSVSDEGADTAEVTPRSPPKAQWPLRQSNSRVPKVDLAGLETTKTPAQVMREQFAATAAAAATTVHRHQPRHGHAIAEKKQSHRAGHAAADMYVGTYSNALYGPLTITAPSAADALAAFPDHSVSDAPVTLILTWSSITYGLSTYDGVAYNGTMAQLPYGLALGMSAPNLVYFQLAPGQGAVQALVWVVDEYQPPFFAKTA